MDRREENRRHREMDALYEISKVLSLSTDIGKALTSTLTIVHLFLGMRNGTVALFDPVMGDLFIEAAPGMSDAERMRERYRPGEGMTGRIFHAGFPMVIPDAGSEPLLLNRTGAHRDPEQEPMAFLGVPVRDGRVTLGVLTIDRPLSERPSRSTGMSVSSPSWPIWSRPGFASATWRARGSGRPWRKRLPSFRRLRASPESSG